MSLADETVYDVLSEVTGVAKDQIREDQDLVADLDIDSPDALRLLVELEDRLGIEIGDEDAAAMDKVADILRYVRARVPD
jgi:acyl carrier protein